MTRAIVFAAILMSAGAASADTGPYGAIAYAEASDNVYVVTDHDTQEAATAAALADCQKENKSCTIPLWFMNACGAFARASDGSWGTGWGETQDLAKDWAIRTCGNYGGKDCRLRVVMCSPGGAGYIAK